MAAPFWASLVAQTVRNPPTMQEIWVQSLGWEDPLEKGMATHSSILAWRIAINRGAWWATVHRASESDTTEGLSTQHRDIRASCWNLWFHCFLTLAWVFWSDRNFFVFWRLSIAIMSLLLLAPTLQVRSRLKNKRRKVREVFSIQIDYLDY